MAAARRGWGGCAFDIGFELGTAFAFAMFKRLLAKGAASSAAPMQGERWRKLGDSMEAVCRRWAWVRVLSGGGDGGEGGWNVRWMVRGR